MLHGQLAFADVPSAREVCHLAARGVRPPMELPPDRHGAASLITDCWAQSPGARPPIAEVMERIVRLIGPAAEPRAAALDDARMAAASHFRALSPRCAQLGRPGHSCEGTCEGTVHRGSNPYSAYMLPATRVRFMLLR